MSDQESEASRARKRTFDETQDAPAAANGDDSSSDDDDDFGPALPSHAPKKRKRKLPYANLYVAALPAAERYSRSLMHRDQLCYTTFTPLTDFLITTSIDGVVKFWKKNKGGIEFVKEYSAHGGKTIMSVSVSADGRSFATAGADKTVKIFDVVTFDLLTMLEFESVPKCVCWIHRRGAPLPLLAVALESDSFIRIYDGRGENKEPLHTLKRMHRQPVSLMSFNNEYDCVISCDVGGMLEYWAPQEPFNLPENVFKLKSQTSLYLFKKEKSVPSSLTISPDGKQFATFSFPDRQVRIFDFASGKLHRCYDESINTAIEMQQAGTAYHKFEELEFGRRLAVERDLDNEFTRPRMNVVFDETGHFVLYGSIVGVKVLNTFENRIVKVYGKTEPFRPLNLALYQGQPDRKAVTTVEMAASDNPLLKEAEARDALLISTGSAKPRFYMFSNNEPISKSERDVHNEKPRNVGASGPDAPAQANEVRSGAVATLHTTLGDIVLRLFPSIAPKAVENFVTHARNGYYDNVIFHRVIKSFMIQTGDPLGDGTGGESIWGGVFENEISPEAKHKKYSLSMANAGPNTNGSQFFITTADTPWLDGKHTVFGKAIDGWDVIHAIEKTSTHKEKPKEDIKIVSISVA
ncbi:peptidyl-prolyl cis-trans isomerase cypE [Phyllosticta capitalensis]